jgi:hypothetical protein
VEKILKKKGNTSSPGPDQLSYMIYKKLDCLHFLISLLFNRIIQEQHFPTCWKKGNVVLIHKKGETDDPKNFRPICLTNCLSKVFTSLLASFTMRHMDKNNLMAVSQKGFRESTSGCLEHQFTLQTLLEKCKRIGRSDLVIVMTDLADAFGSVKHDLIHFALEHYRFHPSYRALIKSMYSDLAVTFRLGDEMREVQQERGVFQGDPLSPVLFNVVINLILQPLDEKKLKESGATVDQTTKCNNITFADDITLLARSVKDMNVLLLALKRGLDWSKCLTPAPHKFQTRHYSKVNNKFTVVDPQLAMNGVQIPAATDKDMTFKLLGKKFPLPTEEDGSLTLLKDRITEVMNKIENAPVENRIKLDMTRSFARSFLQWELTVYDVPASLFDSKLIPIVSKKLKKWSGLAHPANTDMLYMPKSQNGYGFPDLLSLHHQAQLSRAHIIRNSKDNIVQTLQKWHETHPKPGRTGWNAWKELDRLTKIAKEQCGNLERYAFKEQRNKICEITKKEVANKRKDSLMTLQVQKEAIMTANGCEGEFPWMHHFLNMSAAEAKFAMNSLTDTLPTPQQLLKWKGKDYRSGRTVVDDHCQMCLKDRGTLGHILSSCPVALSTEGGSRYTWRHDKVLTLLADTTRKWGCKEEQGWNVMTDERGGAVREWMDSFSSTLRPDLVAVHEDTKKVMIMELTVPMEHNIKSKHEYKTGKYEKLCQDLKEHGYDVAFNAVEIGCRGMVEGSACSFLRSLKIPKKKINELLLELSTTAMKCSWQIFNSRYSPTWTLQ